MRYLSETSNSPLQREMVEIQDPYCSSISYNIIENSVSALYFSFENVPLDKIDSVYAKMRAILENIGSGNEKFDMNRMQNILERCILEYYSSLESNPHEAIAFASIADSLYGEKREDVSFFFNNTFTFIYCSTVPNIEPFYQTNSFPNTQRTYTQVTVAAHHISDVNLWVFVYITLSQ